MAGWSYAWDAENRLVEKTSTLPTTGGFTRYKLEFAYDYGGRRVEKKVTNLANSSVVTHRRYLYDGRNLAAEFAVSDTSIGVMQRSYTWGLDVAGSLGDAMGGIGALVQTVDHTGTATAYLPGYDGAGNVTAMMKSNGDIVAAYEYGPFGEPLRAAGAYAATNPFRKATKYTDNESGLIYYGYRYYSPSLGRFINRDPIGEQGGINLYAFVGNDPVNRWDVLGLDWREKPINFLKNIMGGENYDWLGGVPITQTTDPNSAATPVERSGVYVGSVNWRSTGVFFTFGKFEGYLVDPKSQEVVYVKGGVYGFGIQLGHFSGQQGIAFQANSPEELNRAKGGIFLASAGFGVGSATFFGGEWSAGAYPLNGGGARLIDNQLGPEFLKLSPDMSVLDLMERPKIGFGGSLSFQGVQINEVTVKAPPMPPPPTPPSPVK